MYVLIAGVKILEALAKIAADRLGGNDLPLDQPLAEQPEQVSTLGDGTASASEVTECPIKKKTPTRRTEVAASPKRSITLLLLLHAFLPKMFF